MKDILLRSMVCAATVCASSMMPAMAADGSKPMIRVAQRDAISEPTDAQLTARVEAALQAVPALRAQEIHVHTVDAEVYLRGFAQTSDQIADAGTVAAGIDRVKDVHNELQIRVSD
jgi:osmotically-inducible protein OsmY